MTQELALEDCDVNDRQRHRDAYDAWIEEGDTLYRLGCLYWADFGPAHLPVRKDRDVVAANFPQLKDVTILSPAFMWPETVPAEFAEGIAAPTDQETFDRFVSLITARNSWAKAYRAPVWSEEGRELWHILLSNSTRDSLSCDSDPSKLRIWLQGGVHGNEPAGEQALLALLGKMDADQSYSQLLLEKADILIVPRFNPDGIAVFNRCGGYGVDPNRDYVRFALPQSKHFRKLFCNFAPHIAVDMHEYSAKATHEGQIHAADVMFSAAKNLNIHPDLRRISEEIFVPKIGCRLAESKFRWGPYMPTNGARIFFSEAGSDGKIGRNCLGLTQCISFLCEIRGIGIADQHFHRRTAAGLKFLQSIFDVAVDHKELVQETVATSIACFTQGEQDIVIIDEPNNIDREFTMVERKTGFLIHTLTQFRSMTPPREVLVRGRPTAYVFPATMIDIADRLGDLGIVVDILQNEWMATVEQLIISTAVLGDTYPEGMVCNKITTEAIQGQTTLSAGSYVVNTKQRNAALAFLVLEPENCDSYVSLNIIRLVTGDTYPVYRVRTLLHKQ